MDTKQEPQFVTYSDALKIAKKVNSELPTIEQLKSWFPVMDFLEFKKGKFWSLSENLELLNGQNMIINLIEGKTELIHTEERAHAFLVKPKK